MPTARVFPFTAFRNSGWTALARVQGPDGANLTQTTTTGVSVTVKQQDGTQTYTASLTVADVIFDTLQGTPSNPDARWREDETGFNFACEIPATAFPAAGHYRIEFVFNPAAGEDFPLIFEGAVRSKF